MKECVQPPEDDDDDDTDSGGSQSCGVWPAACWESCMQEED